MIATTLLLVYRSALLNGYKRTTERQGKLKSLPPQFITYLLSAVNKDSGIESIEDVKYLLSAVRKDSGIESIEDVKSGNGTLCTTELVLEYSGFGNTSESSSPVYLCAT